MFMKKLNRAELLLLLRGNLNVEDIHPYFVSDIGEITGCIQEYVEWICEDIRIIAETVENKLTRELLSEVLLSMRSNNRTSHFEKKLRQKFSKQHIEVLRVIYYLYSRSKADFSFRLIDIQDSLPNLPVYELIHDFATEGIICFSGTDEEEYVFRVDLPKIIHLI